MAFGVENDMNRSSFLRLPSAQRYVSSPRTQVSAREFDVRKLVEVEGLSTPSTRFCVVAPRCLNLNEIDGF